MRLNSWLVHLYRRSNPTFRSVRRSRRISAPTSAIIESLESRRMLSGQTITVSLSGDTHVAGQTTLRDAITTANSDSGGDTIVFAANVTGTITLTQGPLSITNSMTISGPGSGILTISGNNTSRIFNVTSSASSNVTISGLTLLQGNSATSVLNAGLGGAIYNSGTLALSNDVFSSNTANDGGALLSTGILTSANNTFAGNSATSYGGALFNSGTLTSTNDTFSGNSAANGGGIENLSLLTIAHDTLTTNSATAQGGAVDNEGTTVSSGNTFSANLAVNQQSGGAGAGIYNAQKLTSTNDTFFSNTAWNGSGICSVNATLSTVNDTIVGNTGKGVVVGATAWFSVNTIVAGNNLGPGFSTPADVINNGSTVTASCTLIGDANSAGGIADGSNGNIVGRAIGTIFVTNAQGTPILANNGGPTNTIGLLAGGPAIGVGGSLTVLATSMTASGSPTTIAIANSVLVAVGDLLRIDNELVMVTSVIDGTHVSVLRGQSGTISSTHLANASIYLASDATGVIRVDYDLGALAKINHAPVGTSGTVSGIENAPYTMRSVDFGFTDPMDTPSNALLAVKFVTLPGAGTLADNGTAITAGQFISATDISTGRLIFTPKSNLDGGPYFLCQFQVEDNGGTAGGGQNLDPSPKVLKISIAHVNHAPVGATATVTAIQNTAYAFKSSDFGFTDPNDPSPNSLLAVKFTIAPTAGTLTDNGVAVTAGQFVSAVDIRAGKLLFTPSTNLLGGPFFAGQFQVQDNGGRANGGMDLDPSPKVVYARIIHLNDPPVGTSATLTTVKNTSYTLKTSDFGFNGTSPNTLLAVQFTIPTTGGSLTDNGAAVTAGQFISVADISAGKLVYTPALNVVGGPYFVCKFQVEDNGGTAYGRVNLDPVPKVLYIKISP